MMMVPAPTDAMAIAAMMAVMTIADMQACADTTDMYSNTNAGVCHGRCGRDCRDASDRDAQSEK